MRSFIALPVFASGAFAVWNGKICNNAGGCVQGTWNPPDPFVCPDNTRLNIQQTAANSISSQAGVYEIVSKDQFPTTCLTDSKPSDGDILVVHTTEFDQKMYSFVRGTCTEANPEKMNCYNKNPNPTSHTLCQLYDTNGNPCNGNPKAGTCERWGGSTVRPQCNYWRPGLPDLPRENGD